MEGRDEGLDVGLDIVWDVLGRKSSLRVLLSTRDKYGIDLREDSKFPVLSYTISKTDS